MTTPKVGTISRNGARLYVHPETGEKAPSVTSILGMLPKPYLQHWAAKRVATHAVQNAGTLVQMILTAKGDHEPAIDWLKGAPRRDTKEAADTGSAVHDMVERMARGESVRVHPDLQPYADHFQAFLDRFQPEFLFMEETIWSETHNYAGSFDFMARIMGETVIGDYKTTRSGVHEEVALQLAAYARADYIIRPDGGRVPMPRIEGGCVLHLRPEAWGLYPVSIRDEVFETFLHLKAVMEWERNLKAAVIGRPL